MSLTIAWDLDGVVLPWTDIEDLPHFQNEQVQINTTGIQALERDFPALIMTWHNAGRASGVTELRTKHRSDLGAAWPHFASDEEFLDRHAGLWWKLAAIRRWLDEHRDTPEARLVWVDDDADYSLRHYDLLDLYEDEQLIVIDTDTELSLTPEHLTHLRELASRFA